MPPDAPFDPDKDDPYEVLGVGPPLRRRRSGKPGWPSSSTPTRTAWGTLSRTRPSESTPLTSNCEIHNADCNGTGRIVRAETPRGRTRLRTVPLGHDGTAGQQPTVRPASAPQKVSGRRRGLAPQPRGTSGRRGLTPLQPDNKNKTPVSSQSQCGGVLRERRRVPSWSGCSSRLPFASAAPSG